MPKRSPRSQQGTQELQRKRWLKALGIARILFEEDGYHTAYLTEIEAFLRQHPVPIPDTPPALDEDTNARVARLAERMARGTVWCDDPQDPRRGTEEDLGQVYEEVRQLIANDPQAAQALLAAYAAAHGPEVLPSPAADTSGDASAQPPAHVAGLYRLDHYPHSRFWGVYDKERLIAVTVYRRGAREVVGRLEMHERTIADLKRQLGQLPSLG